MIGNSNYIGTSLSELIQEVKSKEKTYSDSSKKSYINKDLRTDHWVVHSLLKRLYYNNFLLETDD